MENKGGKNSLGVFHLAKSLKHKRNPKKTPKANFLRNRLTDEDKKQITYEKLEQLYELWKEYYTELVGDPSRTLDDRMLKADYHGALLVVSEADNSTMIGKTGIVAMETRLTFQLVTKENKYIIIPKQGSVFQFVLAGRVFTLFGDNMRYKPCLRGKKRLRGALPVFLR